MPNAMYLILVGKRSSAAVTYTFVSLSDTNLPLLNGVMANESHSRGKRSDSFYLMSAPASTGRATPVMYRDSSEARNKIALLTSAESTQGIGKAFTV